MIKPIAPLLVISTATATIASLCLSIDLNSAQAATIQFNDWGSFQTQTTGLTTINFEGLVASGKSVDYSATGLSLKGVNFTGSNNYLYVIDPAYDPALYQWNSGAMVFGLHQGTITATLPSGITALGSDLMSSGSFASPFIVGLSTGETFSLNSLTRPNRQFIGFTTDTPITSISFYATRGYPLLDNFRFGTANITGAAVTPTTPSVPGISVLPGTAVPEPFTAIGTLIGSTAALRIKKQLKFAPK